MTVGEPNVRTDYLQVDVRAYSADDTQEMAGQESVRDAPQAVPGETRQVTILARANLTPGLQHIRAAGKSDGLD